MQAGQIEQHTGFHQLVIVFPHRGKEFLARHFAGFGVLAGFDYHHKSHNFSLWFQ